VSERRNTLSGKLLAAILIGTGLLLGAVADHLRREQQKRLPVESERLRIALLKIGPELADRALDQALTETASATSGSCTHAAQFDVASTARDWLDVRLLYRCELSGDDQEIPIVRTEVWYPLELERSGDSWVRASSNTD